MANRPKSAHRYNVQEQQEVYKEEISRIWKAQWASLSNAEPPVLTQADEERARGRGRRGGSTVAETPAGMGSLAGTPRARAGTPDSEAGDGEGSVASGKTGGYGQNKTLRIKRLVSWTLSLLFDQS